MGRGAETLSQRRKLGGKEAPLLHQHLAEAGGLDFKVSKGYRVRLSLKNKFKSLRSGLFSKEHFCSKFFLPH